MHSVRRLAAVSITVINWGLKRASRARWVTVDLWWLRDVCDMIQRAAVSQPTVSLQVQVPLQMTPSNPWQPPLQQRSSRQMDRCCWTAEVMALPLPWKPQVRVNAALSYRQPNGAASRPNASFINVNLIRTLKRRLNIRIIDRCLQTFNESYGIVYFLSKKSLNVPQIVHEILTVSTPVTALFQMVFFADGIILCTVKC